MNYQNIITIEACKRGGRPCVRKMRIAVADVLGWLAAGMTHQEILADYPELTEEDIRACLAFAADRERRVMTAAYNWRTNSRIPIRCDNLPWTPPRIESSGNTPRRMDSRSSPKIQISQTWRRCLARHPK